MTSSQAINNQVLGMQKAIDTLILIGSGPKAIELAKAVNLFIMNDPRFKANAEHTILVVKEDGEYHTALVPKPHGREGKTKDGLISLFMFDSKGPNYFLSYDKLGNSGKSHKADLPALRELMKEGLVTVADENRKRVLYRYTPKPTQS